MSAPSAGGTAGPVSPVYPFNEPGQPIMLYDGPIGGLAANEVPGTVELACTLRPSLEWSVGSGTRLQLAAGSPVTLLLRRSAGDAQLPAYVRGIHGGWSNGARLGRADLPLQRIVAHWFNLPDCLGPRWVTEAGGWRISLDVRPDLQRIWTELQRTDTYVMTHVMEVRQADGDGFTAEEAGRLLETLHIGMSFALGRWAAPMLPVGEDTDGRVVWEDWRLPLCDRAQDDGSGWWTTQDHQDLADFLGRIIPFFADPDKRAVLRLPMMYAIISGRDQGFVEQRITSGATGLEHITWQRLVVGGVVTKPEYNRIVAHARLRYVLVEARIPVGIEPDLQPSIAAVRGSES